MNTTPVLVSCGAIVIIGVAWLKGTVPVHAPRQSSAPSSVRSTPSSRAATLANAPVVEGLVPTSGAPIPVARLILEPTSRPLNLPGFRLSPLGPADAYGGSAVWNDDEPALAPDVRSAISAYIRSGAVSVLSSTPTETLLAIDDGVGGQHLALIEPRDAHADINSDGRVDRLDLQRYVEAFGARHPLADTDGDRLLTGADVALYLGRWTEESGQTRPATNG